MRLSTSHGIEAHFPEKGLLPFSSGKIQRKFAIKIFLSWASEASSSSLGSTCGGSGRRRRRINEDLISLIWRWKEEEEEEEEQGIGANESLATSSMQRADERGRGCQEERSKGGKSFCPPFSFEGMERKGREGAIHTLKFANLAQKN